MYIMDEQYQKDLEYADSIIKRLDDMDVGTDLLSRGEKLAVLKKAQTDALYQFYKSLFARQYLKDFVSEGITPLEELESKDHKVVIERARHAVVSKPPYAFITVNPYNIVSQEDLAKYIERFLKRKIVDSYYYVYEVRKSDMTGLHCHILLKYNCKPYDLKRNAQNTFKNVCDESNPSVLNIKYIEYDILDSKISYMNGQKKDAKLEGVEATKKYRAENFLKEFYESTPPLPCRGAE